MRTLLTWKTCALFIACITLSACGDDSDDPDAPLPPVANVLPTAEFIAPTPTAAIQEGTAISAAVNATDPDGTINHVRLFLNDNLLSEDASSPYEWTADNNSALSSLPVGSHELKADVTDNDDGVTTIMTTVTVNAAPVENVLPTAEFVAPTPTEALIVGDSMSVTVDASDSDGTISSVILSVNINVVSEDTEAPYSWLSTEDAVLANLAAGSYELTALITDNDGGETTINTTVNVNTPTGNVLPTATFVAPTPTAALTAGDSMSVTVDATDSDGTISSVRLSLNNNVVRDDTEAPYSWTPGEDAALADLAAGSYALSALVTDNDGGETTISTTIVVNEGSVATGDCQVSGQLKQWHRVAVTCEGPEGSENNVETFTGQRFNVNFQQGNTEYTVPGHFAADGDAANTGAISGNKWRAYFTPTTTGTWNFTTSFRSGNNIAVSLDANEGTVVAGIDAVTGTINVAASDASAPDFRARGLLQHKDGERYQRFAGDDTVYIQGGMGSPENIFGFDEFDNTIKNTGGSCKGILHSFAPHAADWNSGDPTWDNGRGKNLIGLINYIASQGVNSAYIMLNTVRGDGCDAHPWVVYNESGNEKTFDVSKLDQWEIALTHMTQKGILIHAMTQETENDQLLNGGGLELERKLYYRELISRFAHHPALQWNLGEENTNTSSQQIAFANYIKALDPYEHSILMHTFPNGHNNYTALLGVPTFDGPSFQFGNIPESASGGVYGKSLEWIEKSTTAGKPWISTMSEASGGNAPTPNTSVTSLQRIYWMWASVMGGGSGFEWYLKNNGAGHAYDLAVENLREFDAHWKQSGHLVKFFRDILQTDLDINLQSLNPDNNAATGNAWVLSDPGNSYIIFLREGGDAALNLSGNNNYSVSWFNPRTGESSNGSDVSPNQNLGTPPTQTNQDWVAVLTVTDTGSNLHPDIVSVRTDIALSDILREPGGNSWKDSYSVGDKCYCDSTFDHNIGPLPSGIGNMTVKQVCDAIGPGPGVAGRPIYNDIQCGNGPANDAGDEDWCPGRVDIGKEGCRHIGPTWKLDNTNGVQSHTYGKTDGPIKNPLKGWNSGWWNDHPESSVGFQYIKWKEFEPTDGNFDYAAVENIIDRPGSKGRHLILRLYCDWHGDNAASDCPDWMYSQQGVARLQGDNGRYITDFNNAAYLTQAQEAIQALADRYDNDPRIYSFQMGLIGYWGEWHSFGSDFSGDGYEITDATRMNVLNNYKNSFSRAKFMARYPWREPTQTASGIGFHNDFFVANNGHSDEFDVAVQAGDQWLENPIGGEVPPRDDGDANTEKFALYQTDKGLSMIETGHYSTMKAGSYRVTDGDANYPAYLKLHKRMGYNYQIDEAKFSENINPSSQFTVELNGSNIGVAPMYYDWDVQFALLDANNSPVAIKAVESDLTKIMPDTTFTFSSNIDLSSVNSGAYKFAVRIIQPDADKVKANAWKLDPRNTYILFSNNVPDIAGTWNTSNQLLGGWSVLGDVTVN